MPKATSTGVDFTPIPAGVQHAVCYQVIDLGTQPQFGNFPARRKVMVGWELPNEKIMVKSKDGTAEIEMPRSISKDYTLSTDKKANLRKDLAAWRGRDFTEDEAKEFDVSKLIGANCQVQVIHKPSKDGTKTYANIGAIMALPKGTAKLAPENPTLVWDIPEQGTITFPEGMAEWIQNKIKNSEEYVDRVNGRPSGRGQPAPQNQPEGADEDVPF